MSRPDGHLSDDVDGFAHPKKSPGRNFDPTSRGGVAAKAGGVSAVWGSPAPFRRADLEVPYTAPESDRRG